MDEKESKFLFDRVVRRKYYIEKTLKTWGNQPPYKVPSRVYNSLALDAETIAVDTLLLGNMAEALNWFCKSSEYYYLQVESQRSLTGTCSWEGEMGECKNSFDMAVLSGDPELINKCVGQSLDICGEYPTKYPDLADSYHYLIAYIRYFNGELELACEALDKIRINDKKNYDFYNSCKEGLHGLMDCDLDRLISGLNKILSFYEKSVNSKMPYHLISIDATVLIKIAHDKDIIIKPEDIDKGLEKYVPWNLFE